jgi:hypothetical protein
MVLSRLSAFPGLCGPSGKGGQSVAGFAIRGGSVLHGAGAHFDPSGSRLKFELVMNG